MVHYQHTTQHGLHVATAEMPHMESVSLALYLPVGSRYEQNQHNGAAHYLEHMIFKGTQRRSVRELTMEIEGNGGTINAYTTEDLTCIDTRGPSELLPLFTDILCDMAWHSTFPHEEIEREREVIEEEITMYYENPGEHIDDILSRALWKTHPLGQPITGTQESISNLDREQISNFHRTHYLQPGAILAAAGAITSTEVSTALSNTKRPELNAPQIKPTTFSGRELATPTILTEQRDIEQAHLALGFYCEGEHSHQRYALRILSLILGETMSSRLFQEVREKRALCYSINSDYELFEDVGSFQIHAGLDATRLPEAVHAIQHILQDLAAHGITQKELDQAIRYATAQHRISFEGTEAQMSWIGDSISSYGKILDPQESRNSIRNVTRDDVLQTAQSILQSQNRVAACISPLEDDRLQNLLASH